MGLAATSYGQGYISFQNYASTPYYAVVYGSQAQGIPAGLANTGAGPEVSVELGYEFGTQTSFTLVPSSVTPMNPALQQGDNTPAPPAPAIGGWFIGPTVTIAGYSSGNVEFEMLATANSGAAAGATGSLVWTEPASAIATGISSPGEFTALPGDTVLTLPVPEPTTLALAGLGLAALVVSRRKKA